MATFQFRTVPHIHAGRGASGHLARIAAPLMAGVERVVLVTDKGVRQFGLIDAALDGLDAAGCSVLVIDDVVADPPEDMVLAATERAREFGAQLVIGFGGGSSMDTAKLVALLLGCDQPLADMYGVNQVKGARLPLILIPTTAGTGSEVTPISVVTVGETSKMGVNDPVIYGDLAVLDAELTLGLPSHETAGTGIDAMVQGNEAYTPAIKKHTIYDTIDWAGLKTLRSTTRAATLHGGALRAC